MKKKQEKRLTLKQGRFLKYYFESGNGTKAAMKAYDTDDPNCASVIASRNLKKLKNVVVAMMELKGISLGSIVTVVNEATKAKKVITSPTGPDYKVPDHKTRLKAVEIAGKWLGLEKKIPAQQTQINIFERLRKEEEKYLTEPYEGG